MKTIFFNNRIILHIEDSVLNQIFKYAQVGPTDLESGGILLGKCYKNQKEYIISDISEPSVLDKRTRFSFIRSKKHAQTIINKTWDETNGFVNYMGEWHTHPEDHPSPSLIDRNLMREIASDGSAVFPHIFLLILGSTRSLYLGVIDAQNPFSISAEEVWKVT